MTGKRKSCNDCIKKHDANQPKELRGTGKISPLLLFDEMQQNETIELGRLEMLRLGMMPKVNDSFRFIESIRPFPDDLYSRMMRQSNGR